MMMVKPSSLSFSMMGSVEATSDIDISLKSSSRIRSLGRRARHLASSKRLR